MRRGKNPDPRAGLDSTRTSNTHTAPAREGPQAVPGVWSCWCVIFLISRSILMLKSNQQMNVTTTWNTRGIRKNPVLDHAFSSSSHVENARSLWPRRNSRICSLFSLRLWKSWGVETELKSPCSLKKRENTWETRARRSRVYDGRAAVDRTLSTCILSCVEDKSDFKCSGRKEEWWFIQQTYHECPPQPSALYSSLSFWERFKTENFQESNAIYLLASSSPRYTAINYPPVLLMIVPLRLQAVIFHPLPLH